MTKFLLSVLLIFSSLCTIAQRQISGKVTNTEGVGLASTSILVSGTKKGVTTDKDGSFSINAPSGKTTLEISAIGYNSQSIELGANESSINITLSPVTKQMDAVVVTALGIGKKARTLTYSTQSISNDDLTTVKNTNVLNSLNGKVAGAQISRTSGGAGGSVKVILRGDKSTRNSQPLYVVDGMPVVNTPIGPDAGLYNSTPDAGDVLSTINPDDIESINVLKGASASTLYGSLGSNGVILITTKRGKSGVSRIDFTSSVTFDKVAILPELQNSYNQTTPSSATSPGSEDSWGTKGASQPNSNYAKDFFQTGVTFINSVSLSSGNDRSSNFLSYSNTDNKGILPTSKFKQNTLTFRQNSKYLNNKLILDGTFIGSVQNVHNRLTPGIYFNPLSGLYLMPRGQNFNSFKNFEYFSQSRYLNAQNWWNINFDKDQANGGGWGGQDYQQNPYWILNRNAIDNRNQNIYASLSLKYLLKSWLSIQARGNANNFINEFQRDIYATTQATYANFNGNIRNSKSYNTTLYGDVILQADKKLNEDWGITAMVGSSIQEQQGKTTTVFGTPTVPNVFLESALDKSTIDIRNFAVGKRMESLFGTVQLSYKNKLFLDMSDRHDWSSSLAFTPSGKSGYNYYSVGTSAILSDIFKMPSAVNFAKLSASYAVVGGDLLYYSTLPLYTFGQGGASTPPSSTPITEQPGFGLKPEMNKSFEIGTQWNLLDNKLGIDFTWYNTRISNQYFQAISTSFGVKDINAGVIKNTGVELSLSYKVIDKKSVTWNTTLNFSRNRNEIVELFDPSLVPSATAKSRFLLLNGGGYSQLVQGGSFGDLYGRTIATDQNGRMVVDNVNHLPVFVDSLFGNANPKFILGWNNSFKVKDFTVNFLIDGKFGGKVLSITEGYLDQMGVSKRTAAARDNGGTVSITNAVDQSGNAWSGTVDAKAYYTSIGGKTPAGSAYAYDATAIRLRELSIGYQLPIKLKGIRNINFSVIGNNLFFFSRKAPFDPEQVAGVNPGGAGIDAFGLPAYRSIGFNLKCSF